MKILILLIIISQCFLVHADELRIHVIKPKIRINWSSPASLGVTSGINSMSNDFAPIGHFALDLNCSVALSNGVKRVLTGMERIDKKESRRITIDKKLGLGSVLYSFKGNLVSAKISQSEITKAHNQDRLRTIIVPLSSIDCNRGLEFIEKWIQNASYTVYGGNKDTLHGEGGGCADFMSTIFKVVTGKDHPSLWYAKVRLPSDLIGNGSNVQVPFSKVLSRFSWAKENENHTLYKTADSNSIHDWLVSRVRGNVYYYTDHLYPTNVMYSTGASLIDILYMRAQRSFLSSPLEPFKYKYDSTPEDERRVWKSITTF
jgi:hypothetical protein